MLDSILCVFTTPTLWGDIETSVTSSDFVKLTIANRIKYVLLVGPQPVDYRADVM